MLFVNLEHFALRSRTDIETIARTVEEKLAGLDKRVYAIVNYDHFSILSELLDDYSAVVRQPTDRFYSGVSRYTTSGFFRIKFGEALQRRGVAPRIFESAENARSDWRHVG
jgi:propionate CoA-transferase